MGWRDWICRRRAVRTDHTRDVIAEAEKTRRDLVKLTARLDAYATDLKTRVQIELQREIAKGIRADG